MPFHRHEQAHISVVISGLSIELRDGIPERTQAATVTAHLGDDNHALYFCSQTRVMSFILAKTNKRSSVRSKNRAVIDPATCERLQSCSRRQMPQTVRQVLDALSEENKGKSSAPTWLTGTINSFPWSASVPLADAARRAGVHLTHFDRVFRHYRGMTPGEYRRRARLREASRLLTETSASLVQVAMDSGFTDQSHLTATFSKCLGLPPAQYRRAFSR